MKSVGIEITSTCVRIAEMSYINRKHVVTGYTEHALKMTPGHDQSLDVIEILRGLNLDPTDKIVMAIGQERFATRFRSFPFRERQKIYKSLPFELEDETPFTDEDAIFEAKILRYSGPGADVLAMACPKTAIDETLDLAKDVGIKLTVLSSDGSALTNLMDRWWETPTFSPDSLISSPDDFEEEEDESESEDGEELRPDTRKVQVVLHIGHEKSLLIAKDQDGAISVNTLMWGYRSVARAIAETYEIPYTEAIKEYQDKAFILLSKEGATKEQDEFSNLIAAQVDKMIRPLRRVLLEWMAEFKCEVNQVLLTGEGCNVDGLGPYLTTKLEVPTNPLDYTSHLQQVDISLTPREYNNAAVALGLAIEGHKRPRNPAVNFLKDEYAIKSEVFAAFWKQYGPLAKVVAALFVLVWVYAGVKDYASHMASEASYDNLVSEGKRITKGSGNPARIRRHIKETKSTARIQEKLGGLMQVNSALDLLKNFNQQLPGRRDFEIEIKQFELKYNKLQVSGHVYDPTGTAVVQTALQNLGKGKVTEEAPPSSPEGTFPFAFSTIVERKAGR